MTFVVQRTASAAALVSATVCLGAFQDPATPTFRTGVKTVAIYATVQDKDGRLVPDLTRSDFQIFDNGRLAELTLFSNEIQPITVALMLDMSYSMIPSVDRVRASATHLVDALSDVDRARIGTFGLRVFVSPILTSNKTALKRVVSEEVWPGGGTPLYSAIDLAMTSLAAERGRRVVLVVTDGTNNAPGPQLGDLRKRALANDFMVYAIEMEDRGLVGAIQDLAADTGGGHFKLKNNADLDAACARVIEELRHQYVLGFAPAVLDGTEHKLEVRIAASGLKARARKSYLAGEAR
jgi:VWFA-related protein